MKQADHFSNTDPMKNVEIQGRIFCLGKSNIVFMFLVTIIKHRTSKRKLWVCRRFFLVLVNSLTVCVSRFCFAYSVYLALFYVSVCSVFLLLLVLYFVFQVSCFLVSCVDLSVPSNTCCFL